MRRSERRAERRAELKKELEDLEEFIDYAYGHNSISDLYISCLYLEIAKTHRKIAKARKAYEATFKKII